MRARDHTDRMLDWWRDIGVDRVDLAVRRPRPAPDDHGAAWLWQRAVSIADLPRLLPWTRAQNAQRADIYARPARGSNWPVVFLDDLAQADALDITTRHPALCVHTSPEGGCQLWLRCAQPLDEERRYRLQKHLAGLLGADPGSVSGEHLGRLAGYCNWKRRGPWVNVLAATLIGQPLTDLHLDRRAGSPSTPQRSQSRGLTGRTPARIDTSPSAREWGWVMGALQAGLDPESVYLQLLARARPRRGADAERYAKRTVHQALKRLTDLSPPKAGRL